MKPFRSLRRAASLALAVATLALLASSCATSNKYGCPSSLNHGGGTRYSSR